MTKYKVSYIINGLHDVLPNKEDKLEVDNVIFHYRENERVGTFSLEASNEVQAKAEALQKVDKSLSKICFAYNTEAIIKKVGLYLVDLTNSPNVERVEGSFMFRWGYLADNSESTISKIVSIIDNKKDSLDLALAYYKLGHYDNPLRIECFFSCLTVLIKDINGVPQKKNIRTSRLKNGIKQILHKRNPNLDNNKFEKDWGDCYSEERCSIAHGRGSKLIEISNASEYEHLVNIVHYWTREVIYEFINIHQL